MLLVGLLLLASACKRDADAPLPRGTLYPKPTAPAPRDPGAGRGVLERATLASEAEPNDTRIQALELSDNTIVQGTFSAPAAAPKAAGKRRKRPRRRVLDADWYRLPASEAPGLISRLELRDAPACARLELWPAKGAKAWVRALRVRRQRPVLDAWRRQGGDLLVRVFCLAREPPPQGERGYRLAVSSRQRRLDEETEPNDNPGPQTALVPLGQGVQGTLAHLKDADVFRLDLSAAPPGEALVLGVTGIPGVSLAVTLYDETGEKVLLERRPPRGTGMLVPNLDVRRTGAQPVLHIATLSGIGPDAPYAASIRPLLPVGCPVQAECPERVPIEREPDDRASQAMGITYGSLITGVVDGPGDVDWYAIDGQAGQVASVALTSPSGLALSLAVSDGANPWAEIVAAEPGQPLVFAGWLLKQRRFHVRIAAVGATFDRSQSYLLRVRVTSIGGFESEPGLAAAEPVESMIRTGMASWQRQGALLPAGDVDRFHMDLSGRQAPTEAVLRCAGDGAPGLWCAIVGPDGQSTARLQAPQEAGAVAKMPVSLTPARWTVEVSATPARWAPSTWRVEVADLHALDAALALPDDLTPAAPTPP